MSDTPRCDLAAERGSDHGLANLMMSGIWPLARELERELAAKSAEAERLREDARRYQWLRNSEASIKRTRRATEQTFYAEIYSDCWVRRESLDEAIDIAMATEKEVL